MKLFANTRVPLAAGALAAVALASSAEARWRYCQPWNQERDSHISRVESCDNPVPMPRMAWDDWVADEDAKIRVVVWWGVLTNADAQENPIRFRIAFRGHDENQCLPAGLLYARCVGARRTYVGTDCYGQPVYRFWARLPGPAFRQTAGEHYWLSIAEDESTSPTQEVDFRWSGHRTPKHCAAAQLTPSGAFIQPLHSACDELVNDLAFCLFGRAASGGMNLTPAPRSASIELRAPGDDQLLERLLITPDDNGEWVAFPNVRDGQYDVVLRIPGALPAQGTMTLADGETAEVDFGEIRVGDLDNDEGIGFPDLLIILRNWDNGG